MYRPHYYNYHTSAGGIIDAVKAYREVKDMEKQMKQAEADARGENEQEPTGFKSKMLGFLRKPGGGQKRRPAAKTPTSFKVLYDGSRRTVYVGPQGGHYVKNRHGKFVSVSL